MLCLIILLSFPTLFAQTVKVSSPDVKIVLSVNDNRKPNYAINFIGGSIIKPSCWGLVFKNTIAFSNGFILYAHQEKSANKVWQLPWGERKDVTDHHNELLVTFLTSKKTEGEKFKVRFRLFNTSRG